MMRPPVKLTKRSPIASARPQSARTHRDALDELLDFDIDISSSPNRRSKSKKGASDGMSTLIHRIHPPRRFSCSDRWEW